jgi:hypothetical protein
VVSYFLRYFSSASTEQISPIPPDLSPSVRLPINNSLHSSRKMAFEQRMDIVLTYWHWLEYDSVALATLFTGIGLVALLVLSI